MQGFSSALNQYDTRASLDASMAKLQAMQTQQTSQATTGRFGQLAEFVASLPPDKAAWVSQQTAVQEKVNTMLSVFNGRFLFEQCKSQFEEWCKQNQVSVIDDYVDTFQQTAKSYVNPVDTQSREIEELKRMIADLQNKKTGEML